MAPEGRGKRRVEQPRGALKKGPWTVEEDAVLSEYVRKHGEGNWNAVQRNSGLMRCGKSCRLRWANHLRPNLKKGAFSPEEEAIIVDLHSKLGNKWARMAAQLPGRTDNEIKNYWNTRLKRRQRACMPIYDTKKPETQNHQPPPPSNPLSSSLLSLLSYSKQPPNLSHKTNMSLYDIYDSSSNMKSLQPQFPSNAYTCNPNQNFKFRHQNNSSISSLGLSCKAQFGLAFSNQGRLMALSPSSSFQYSSFNFGSDSTPVSGLSFEQNGVASRAAMDVPSVTPLVPSTTPTSSANATSDYVYTGLSDPDEHTKLGFSRANSGLLGDLLGHAESLKEKIDENLYEGNRSKEDYLWDYKLVDDAARRPHDQSFLPYAGEDFVDQKHTHESSASNSSVGTKATAGCSKEANNPVDDGFLGLLDNFPLTEATHNWCKKDEPMTVKPQFCSSIDAETMKENRTNLLNPETITAPSQVFMGYAAPNPWNNMPGANQI